MVDRGGTTDIYKLANYFAYKISDEKAQDVVRIISKTSESSIPNHIQLTFKELDKERFNKDIKSDHHHHRHLLQVNLLHLFLFPIFFFKVGEGVSLEHSHTLYLFATGHN